MVSYPETQNYKDNLEVLLSAIYHRIVRNGDTVIDGGANSGLHSMPLARLVGPKRDTIGAIMRELRNAAPP